MPKSLLEKRIDQTVESREVFAQEELILDAAEQIWELMDKKGVRKARLAETLGKSAAYVTQLLNGSRNMTLRSLADVASALDAKVHINICDDSRHAGWQFDEVQLLKTGTLQRPSGTVEAINDGSMRTIDLPSRYGQAVR